MIKKMEQKLVPYSSHTPYNEHYLLIGWNYMKQCICCGADLNSENTTWYRQKNYIHKCNECIRKEKRDYARNFSKINRETVNARSLRCKDKLRKSNPVKYSSQQMCASAKKRAVALGLDFDIDSNYIESISPKICPILNIELKYGGGEKANNSASLDKIVPSKGYTKGNVQVVSTLSNTMKNEASSDELLMFAEWIFNTYKV